MSVTLKLDEPIRARNGEPFQEGEGDKKTDLLLGHVLHAAIEYVPKDAKETMKMLHRRKRLGIQVATGDSVTWELDTLNDVISMCQERWVSGDARIFMEVLRLTDEAQEPTEDPKQLKEVASGD